MSYCFPRPSRVLESTGPTNTRRYKVAVYFRGERLSTGVGHSIQQAEMDAACNALKDKAGEELCCGHASYVLWEGVEKVAVL